MKKILLLLLVNFNVLSYSQNIAIKPRLNSSENERQLQFRNVVQNNSNQTLPYPIIFIHGLDSNSEVWIDLRTQLINSGLNFGGRIDFCLNDDGNNNVSNKLVYPTPNADIALYTDYINDLSVGDFYFLNFDVNNIGELFPSDDGSAFNDVLSNESAIVKQGLAVKLAIQIVLQKTGRDKVILMGHSMGGLASREYIQNPSNWQPDGQHHVAKLVTTGTPHGGFTGLGLSPTIDFQSEAFRDLKNTYTISGDNGVYLFGGSENYSTMYNNLIFPFYNVDVNCNGVNADNSNIVGLNQRSLPLTLDYAYIVGNCLNCEHLQGTIEGDGIVRSVNADLNNFYTLPFPRNEFIYTSNATTLLGLHSDLPKIISVNMQALDEPNQLWLAYGVDYGITYKGFIYNQPVNGYPYDFDDYKFTVTNSSIVNILINNITSSTLSARIFDINGTQIGNTYSGNSSNPINISQVLSPGDYYLEIYGTPVDISIINSYNFNLSSTLTSENFTHQSSIKAYPNPFTNQLTIQANETIFKVEIYNLLGQKVKNIIFNNPTENSVNIDLSELAQGNYIAKITSELLTNTIKLIKN